MSSTEKKTYTNEELCEMIQNGDKDAFILLAENCKKLIFKFVAKYSPLKSTNFDQKTELFLEVLRSYKQFFPLQYDEDLVQIGYIALYKAALKYQKGKGAKYITYAYRKIEGAILKELIEQQICKVKIPKADREKYSKYEKAYQELALKYQTHKEIIIEIANRFGDSVNKIERVLGISNLVQSLDIDYDTTKSDENRRSLIETISDGKSIEEEYCQKELDRMLHNFIDQLESKERTVINLVYGLNGEKKTTIKKIAEDNGRSEGTIEKIKKSAERKLKDMFVEAGVVY